MAERRAWVSSRAKIPPSEVGLVAARLKTRIGDSKRTTSVIVGATPAPPGANDTYRPDAAPGGRLPHFKLDGASLYDRLGPEFSLVGDQTLPAAGALAKAAAALGVPMDVVAVDASDCAARFEAGLVLVRPDQHVAWRGDDVDDPEQVLRTATGSEAS